MFLSFTVSKTLERSASVHLLFAFEYVIQASVLASTAIKYGLSLIDNYFEGRWENKVCASHAFTLAIPSAASGYMSMSFQLKHLCAAGSICVLSAAPYRHAAPLCVCGVLHYCFHQLWASPSPGKPLTEAVRQTSLSIHCTRFDDPDHVIQSVFM